jgi:hypothetical protein
MKQMAKTVALEPVEPLIQVVRGERIILDGDLARIYGGPTKRLNEQVKRNTERFAPDFAFRLTNDEAVKLLRSRSQIATDPEGNLKSQFATSSFGHGGRRKLPFAFTEHGAIMAANVLNSPQATQMSVYVVRAFVKMRSVLSNTRSLARKLAQLEKELKSRLDLHETAIVEVLQRVMEILDMPPQPEPKRRQIGFHTDDEETK